MERIVRAAGKLARGRRKKLTSVDKANVLETSRLWREVTERVVKAEFSDLALSHMLVDACAMHLIRKPADFDVIVTENMFGDILTDEASMLAGSMGMLPSASLGDGTRGLYEPIHGSAPDIAGKGVANPYATILSVAMLLRHSLGLEKEAATVESAVGGAIRALSVVGIVSLLAAAACIYDPEQRCGPIQHLGPNSTCDCDDGFVLVGQVCVPCGDHETWQAGVCLCVDGYSRAARNGPCLKGGPGTRCDPTAMTSGCADPRFPACRDRGAGVGYCTATCATDVDCPRGYTCDTAKTPATCKSGAVGLGDACTSSADCDGKDAWYCEPVILQQCIVTGCAVANPLSCPEAWVCCDVRSLGVNMTLCVPQGICPTGR